MRTACLLAMVLLWSCVRNPTSPQAPVPENEAPPLPRFTGQSVKVADQPGIPYELDGVTLRALMIASNDFLRSDSKDQSCWNKPESYRYRVIRQEDIVFIRIHANPAACEGRFLMLDSGVSYAISSDGRILRRLFTGEPEWDSGAEVADGGTGHCPRRECTDAGVPDLAPVLEATWGEPRPFLHQDGGVPGSDGGSPAPPIP